MIFFSSSSVIQSIIVILAAVFVSSSSATNITLAPTAAAVDEYDIFANTVFVANNNDGNDTDDVDGKSLLVILKDEEGVDPEEKCASLANSTGVGDMIIVDYVDTYLRACFMTLLLPTEAAEEVAAALETLKNDPSVEYADTDEGHEEDSTDDFIEDDGDDEFADDFIEDDGNDEFADDFIEDEDEESSNIFTTSKEPYKYLFGRDRINQCKFYPQDKKFAKRQDAKGTKVFILHAGMHRNHVEIKGMMGPKDCHKDFYPTTFSNGRFDGTYYARISCGNVYGVSKNCRFCDVRVLPGNKNYKGNDIYRKVILGLDHVINHCKKYPKVKCVANMSIDKNHGPERNKQVKKKIEQAWDAGISVVALAPAGSRTCKDAYGSSPKVISVGHVKQWDEKQGPYGNCVTVYGSASKRDNAVGRVTGIVASIRGKYKKAPPADVKRQLVKDATWNQKQKVTVALVNVAATKNCPKKPSRMGE